MHDPITLLELDIERAELMAMEQNLSLEIAVYAQSIDYLMEEPDLEIHLSQREIDDINELRQAREHFASSRDFAECILSMTTRT